MGSLFWGCLVSSVLTGAVWGAVVFLFLWQASVYFAQRFVSIVIGIVIIFVLKFNLTWQFGRNYNPGFY